MAKKKINIILILVVLGLWGTVGFRALNRQFVGNDVVSEQQMQQGNVSINKIIKDTFELQKIHRDPFLNREFSSPVAAHKAVVSYHKAVKKAVALKVPKGDPNLQWPNLAYHGYIASKERNEDLVLLTIDSRLRRLKLNDPVNGLIVRKRYKDSIEVFFNSQTRIIRKQ